MLDFGGNVLEFLLGTVILKMIVGHWCAEMILKYGKVWFSKTERNAAIWTHYQARAAGQGHGTDSVLNCGQDSCKLF